MKPCVSVKKFPMGVLNGKDRSEGLDEWSFSKAPREVGSHTVIRMGNVLASLHAIYKYY